MFHQDIAAKAQRDAMATTKEFEAYEPSYRRVALIASAILNRQITPYEVSVIQMSLNLSHVAVRPDKIDEWTGAITQASLAAQLAGSKTEAHNEVVLDTVKSAIREEIKNIAQDVQPSEDKKGIFGKKIA